MIALAGIADLGLTLLLLVLVGAAIGFVGRVAFELAAYLRRRRLRREAREFARDHATRTHVEDRPYGERPLRSYPPRPTVEQTRRSA